MPGVRGARCRVPDRRRRARSILGQRVLRGGLAAAALGRDLRSGRRSELGRGGWGGDPGGRVTPARRGLDGGGRDVASLEVLAAPRAQGPVHPHEAAAVRTDAIQSRPARRTDDPLVVDPAVAARAVMDRLDLGKERLLSQVSLPDLADLLVRPDDLVDPDREDEEHRSEEDDPRGDQIRQDRVVRTLLHVPEGPVRRREPDDDQVDPDQPEAQLDRRAADDPADRLADLVEDVFHAPGRVPPYGVEPSTTRSNRALAASGAV